MGCVSKVLDNPITQIVTDVALTATGNPELIPVANAAETTAGGVASGESFGKALGQGALAGGEALAGQELLGAVGIGQGNTAFNNALGITGDNPAGTGLPDLGSLFGGTSAGGSTVSANGQAIDSATGLPVGQESINPAGATINTATGETVAAPSTATSVTPSSGGFAPAGSASDLAATQVGTQLGGAGDVAGTSTSASPGLGSVGAAENAIGATTTDSLGANTSPIQANTINLGGGSAVAPAAATPSTGGLLNTIESSAAKSAIPLAGLAYEAIKGPASLPSASTSLAPSGAATAPLLALENQGAQEALTGKLTPTQEANVEQYVQKQQNELIQQLASQGVVDPTKDSRYIEGMRTIQENALALQQQYITAAINEATSAGGGASANIANVANQQIQLDKDYQDALAAAFGALGGVSGGLTIKA